MTDIVAKAHTLQSDCLRVMHAIEETDGGGSRANGGAYDNYFKDIPTWFAPFADLPDGPGLRREADTLVQEVCKYLNMDWPPPPGYESKPVNTNPELGKYDTVKENLSGWTGQAASNFRDNYLREFPEFTKNLYTATFVAAQTLKAEAKLWERANSDIHALCKSTDDTVNGMVTACIGRGFEMLLTLFPSVISIASAKESEIGLTAIKEIAGAAGTHAFRDGRAWTPIDLMQPLKESIDELTKRVKDEEQAIKNAIASNTTYLQNHPREYIPPEPKYPGDGSPWDLGHTDDPGRHDKGTDTLGDDNRP